MASSRLHYSAAICLLILFATGVRAQDYRPPEIPSITPLSDAPPALVQMQTPGQRPPMATPPRPPTPMPPQARPGDRPALDLARDAATSSSAQETDVLSTATTDIPNMMGDFPGRPGSRLVCVPRTDIVRTTFVIVQPDQGIPIVRTFTIEELQTTCDPAVVRVPAATRTFKIAENESPRPRDRSYFMFNYFDDVFGGINRQVGNVGTFDAHRETIGFEKTFLCGRGSIGMRVPSNTFWSNSQVPDLGGTDQEFGDLTVILKYAPYIDFQTGNVCSGGLAVTFPTGSSSGSPFHSTSFQPWIGGIWSWGNLFVHGFNSIDIPTDSDDVTLLFNDYGIGYVLFRINDPSVFCTAVVPMAEVHVNTPLNHRGGTDFSDPAGTPEWVALTFGTTFQFYGQITLAVAGAIPITGPKVYDFETLVQLNVFF